MTLRLEGIEKSFGRRVVLAGVSCEFPRGEISTVLGVSGCGKTTVLRIVAGLEFPDRGEVFLAGARITDWPPQRRSMGFVFQDLGVYSQLSVEKNLLLPLMARRVPSAEARKRVRQAAAHFGLEAFLPRPAASLSGGEAQRLALAKALIRGPDVMLLDEPFSHLDAPLRREARRFVFSELRRLGTTSVLVTHDHEDAQEAGGLVLFLDQGRIVQSGSWETLYRQPAEPSVARVVSFREPLTLSGTVRGESGGLRFHCEELSVSLELQPQVLCGNAPLSGERRLLFFRPEDLVAEPVSGPAGSADLDGPVVASFLQGHVRFCRLQHSSGRFIEARLDTQGNPASHLRVPLDRARQLLLSQDSPVSHPNTSLS